LCFDGTGDWIATGFTNVAKIYQLLEEEGQKAFYDGGIGTLSNMMEVGAARRLLLRGLDLATATGLGDKVLRGYMFLVRNYREGDRIYLFGFSRGAYTARVLASMIHNFGILKEDCEHLAPYIWQTMSQVSLSKSDKRDASPTSEHDDKGRTDEPTTTIGKFKRTANRIKKNFARAKPAIAFMGLFDTVSSVGVIGRFATFPNTDKNGSVLRVCHAVAIDEQRNVFPESLFHPQQSGLTEVWFPGVHRDVGGGRPPAESGISDLALEWILGEAAKQGLRLKPFTPTAASPQVVVPDRDYYVALGLYPMLMFSKQVSGYRYLWPNFRHLRVVPVDALVHQVIARVPDYAPENLPPGHPHQIFDPSKPSVGPKRNEVFDPSGGTSGPIADFAMCVYGGTALALVWSALIGTPFGPLWPAERLVGVPFGWLVAMVAVAVGFMLSGGPAKYRGMALQKGKIVFSAVSLVGALALFLAFPKWSLAIGGAVVGAALWGIARFPGLPPMRAVRALPYLLRSVSGSFVASLGVWTLFALLSWLLLGIQAIDRPLGFTYAGLAHTHWGAVVAFVVLGARNVRNLWTDRRMMTRVSRQNGGGGRRIVGSDPPPPSEA
jgi:hypothetical protein